MIKLGGKCLLAFALLAVSLSADVLAAEVTKVNVAYLSYAPEKPPVLSNILPEPKDSGEQGALLGISDNNTTGRFLKQNYELTAYQSDKQEEVLQKAVELKEQGIDLFLANTDQSTLLRLSETLGDGVLIFNVGSPSNELRTSQCLSGVLHTLPSRAMLTDALGQWLISKRLNKWLLLAGPQPEDKAFAVSLKRTAKRMGGKIVAEKVWSFDTDLRRTAQKELPVFTQTKEYDMVLVADERGDFGEYVLYNTWYPRPVAGTQGLTPVAWHRVVEQWGAAQLQSRFEKQSKRWMTSRDYAAWLAMRSIAEAVTRKKVTKASEVFDYLLSDEFQLAAFKGRKLSYRSWSGQLRQPIPLVHPRALVAQAPLEGFLHPSTELDTVGFDKQESKCNVAKSFVEKK